ncbi:MAG: hypothetical protein PUH04_05500 [Firmicutes bacterium]|nr:hypothetical protein [Bacillota bacterium]
MEELGLTNKALLQLLQGKVNGSLLSKMLEHPYFPVLLDTANAYFTEAHNTGFASRNAIIDIGTANIKDFIKEHPEHRIEGQYDIRRLNVEKVTGTEADLEKIKSIFLSMLKDIKKEYDVPQQDISTEELKKQIVTMKKQAIFQKKKKPSFNENDMSRIVMGMFQSTGMDLDEYEQEMFHKMMVHMLQRKR